MPRAQPLSSSTSPAASMASKRSAIAACSRARSSGTSATRTTGPSDGPAPRAPCSAESGVPVSACTSSARWIRWASVGASRAAVGGSTRGELGMQRGPALGGGARVDTRAHGGVGLRQRAQALGQRLEIEHRAAGDDRHTAARAYRRDRRLGIAAKARGGVRLRRVDDVDQVVRNAGACRRVGLRGPDVHSAVDLRGVDADDLALEPLGQCERECALARRGRAHQENRGRHEFHGGLRLTAQGKASRAGPDARRPAARREIVLGRTASAEGGHNNAAGTRSRFARAVNGRA